MAQKIDDQRQMPSDDSPFNRPEASSVSENAQHGPAELICRRCGARFTPGRWQWLFNLLMWLGVVALLMYRAIIGHGRYGEQYTPINFSLHPHILIGIIIICAVTGILIAWKVHKCPDCKSWDTVRVDSAKGEHVLVHPPIYNPRDYGYQGERMYTSGRAYLLAGVLLIVTFIILFFIFNQ